MPGSQGTYATRHASNTDNSCQGRESHALTARDVAILSDLFRFGGLLRGQIQALHFEDCGLRRCNRRLKALTDLGLIAGGPLPLGPLTGPTVGTLGGVGGSQWLYRLLPPAAPLIARFQGIDITEVRRRLRPGSPTYLAHALEIAQVAITLRRFSAAAPEIERRVGRTPFRLARFLVEAEVIHAYEYRPRAEEGNAGNDRGQSGGSGPPNASRKADAWRAEVFRPDAYACFASESAPMKDSFSTAANAARPGDVHAFFEVDLGHTSSDEFSRKLRIHRNYHALGLFSRRYGGADDFLTLTLTTSDRRAENLLRLAARTQNDRAWFTTLEAFATCGPFGAIWRTPADGSRRIEPLELPLQPLPTIPSTTAEKKEVLP